MSDEKEIPESALRWLRQKLSKGPKLMTLAELHQLCEDEPEFSKLQREDYYRDGFEAGFDHAIESMEKLHAERGFSVRAIANRLWKWSNNVLIPWRFHEVKAPRYHDHPIFGQRVRKEK